MNPTETANTSLRVLLHILFKRKFLIITFFIATLLTVGIFTIVSEPNYKASSEILIKMGREHLFVPTTTDSGLRAVSGFSSLEQINSEIELITSQPLIEEVVASVGATVIYEDLLDKDPGILGSFQEKLTQLLNYLGKLIPFSNDNKQRIAGSPFSTRPPLTDNDAAFLQVEKNLDVRGIKKSRIIEISFNHKDPQIAAMVLKKLVDAYLEMRPRIHKSTESYAFFQEQAEFLKKKIMQIENELKALKNQHDVIALDEERTLLLERKAALQADLNTSLSVKVEIENRIQQFRSQLKSTPLKIQKGEQTNLNPLLINTLEERLVTLELKEKELLTKYTDKNHLVVQVREELRIVRQKLTEQESKRYGSANFGPNPTYQKLKEDLYENQAELGAVNGKIKTQTVHLTDYKKRLDKLIQVEYRLNELENQLEVDQKNYNLYLTKYEEERISSEMDSKKLVNVRVIKPSQPPLTPDSPKSSLIFAIGIVAAIFGGIGLALCLEFLNDRLERPEDIENFLNAPVLASVAEYKR